MTRGRPGDQSTRGRVPSFFLRSSLNLANAYTSCCLVEIARSCFSRTIAGFIAAKMPVRAGSRSRQGFPRISGFLLAVHPHEAETIYVIPLQGVEFRCPPEGKLRVFRSRNGGASWQALDQGLPQKDAYVGIYREGMATDAFDPVGA
jgi:hypothetical protein